MRFLQCHHWDDLGDEICHIYMSYICHIYIDHPNMKYVSIPSDICNVYISMLFYMTYWNIL